MNAHDDDPFTQALRDDMPAPGDEARVRSRLVSAGVIAGAVAAPVGAAASSGIAAKVVAWPLAAKVGASLAVVGVVALPVVSRVTRSEPSPAGVVVKAAAPVSRPATAPVRPSLPEPEKPSETMTAPALAVRETVHPAREPAKAPVVTASPLPSIASFEEAPAPKRLDEGSLRAETALMERALSALQRDDVTTARATLAEHARRFPNGHLVRERERALERMLGKETERHAH
jgi:hypothetical protein